MTDSLAVAMISAIPPTVAAIAALVVSVRNGRKADQIHVLVNSNLERIKEALRLAHAEVAVLRASSADSTATDNERGGT